MAETSSAKLGLTPKGHPQESAVPPLRNAEKQPESFPEWSPRDGDELRAFSAPGPALRASIHQPMPSIARQTAAERGAKIGDSRARFDFSPMTPIKIAVKSKRKILLLSPSEILAIEAEGNYVLLVSRADSHLMRESISAIAEKLKAYGFVRIHRSVLVNGACVEEIYPGATGEYMLRMAGGKEYVVSRTYKHNLRLLAQSWIGVDSFIDE